MEIDRREFISWTGKGLIAISLADLVSFMPETKADPSEAIVLPTLEEITALMSKEPSEILKPAIERREIKKFEYTRQTKPEDFYKFLRDNFQNQIVFAYICGDIDTGKTKEFDDTKNSTYDMAFGSGAAITFLYTQMNLKNRTSGVGFLFIELKVFHGTKNWAGLMNLFNVRRMGIPSVADFKRTSEGYELIGIEDTGLKEPNKILKHIKSWTDYYSK